MSMLLPFAANAVAKVTYTDLSNLYSGFNASGGVKLTGLGYYQNSAKNAGMTPAEYAADALAGDITDLNLDTIIDDLDTADAVQLKLLAVTKGTWHILGKLQKQGFTNVVGTQGYEQGPGHGQGGPNNSHITTATFTGLNPFWLDGLPVQIKFTALPDNKTGLSNKFKIEISALSVTVNENGATHAPAPAAVMLAGIGLTIVGWLRKSCML